MKLVFEVPGEPKSKGRPRFEKAGHFTKPRTPAETIVYENLIVVYYKQQCRNHFIAVGVPIKMKIDAYFQIPKSKPKKIQNLMIAEKVRPTKKPDGDNIIKVVADALNGIGYHDDSQIVEVTINKWYSYNPRIRVEIETLEVEDDNK